MIVTVHVWCWTEGHVTEARSAATDLEIDWRDGDIHSALISCGNHWSKIDPLIAFHMLGGRDAATMLIQQYIEEERMSA